MTRIEPIGFIRLARPRFPLDDPLPVAPGGLARGHGTMS